MIRKKILGRQSWLDFSQHLFQAIRIGKGNVKAVVSAASFQIYAIFFDMMKKENHSARCIRLDHFNAEFIPGLRKNT